MKHFKFSGVRRQVLRAGAVGAFAGMAGIGLAACQPKEVAFNGTDITGSDIGSNWSLTDLDGNPRSIADFSGKAVVVFFGFIQCPDVCPTTLAELSQVKQALGDDGDDLQVVFVTVDPERDTPDVMREYLGAFDPSFVGLRGNPEQLAEVAKSFKVFYAKVPGKGDAYTMDHSSGLYVFDPDGDIRLYVRYGQPTDQMVADIRQLLA